MIDVYKPEGALRPEAESALLERITAILVAHEGFDFTDPQVRSTAWVFLHRPVAVYVGGVLAKSPRYKIIPTVPEGQFNRQNRAEVVREVTEAILDAEESRWPRDSSRIWVFPTEIPEGQWGGRGRVISLAEILGRTIGDTDARALAIERIANSRAERVSVYPGNSWRRE
jgi:phenylpyruvate tautomerase PptA (4-oxalocrotonate tautomerase family)